MTTFPHQPLHGGWKKTFVNNVPLVDDPLAHQLNYCLQYSPPPSNCGGKNMANISKPIPPNSIPSFTEIRHQTQEILGYRPCLWQI